MRIRLVLAIGLCAALGAYNHYQATLPVPASETGSAIASPAVEPDAVRALARMASYVRTLRGFELISETTTERGGDRTLYRVRNPDAFSVDIQGRRQRQLFYDGRTLTVFAPRVGFYAEISAPPSIAGALQVAANDYGIETPLADLFFWSAPRSLTHHFSRAATMGHARVGGVDTAQYAFREGDREWQLWIASGAQPLPSKITITDLDHQPRTYTALLSWNVNPDLNAENFAFRPSSGDRRIPVNLLVADAGGDVHPYDRNAAATPAGTVGSIAYVLPEACVAGGRLGTTYYNCGDVWYEPRFSGLNVIYTVVTPPYQPASLSLDDFVQRIEPGRLAADTPSDARNGPRNSRASPD